MLKSLPPEGRNAQQITSFASAKIPFLMIGRLTSSLKWNVIPGISSFAM
jgi:hypothetical protein